MADEIVCWKCGASLTALPLPYGRAEVCPSCRADVRVCRMCVFFDPSRSKQCREPVVDEVRDKERANFCDYFKPRPSAYSAHSDAAARSALDALFGAPSSSTSASDAEKTAEQRAREELDKLFGKKS